MPAFSKNWKRKASFSGSGNEDHRGEVGIPSLSSVQKKLAGEGAFVSAAIFR
jgi:hypothetical protein